MLGVSIVTYRSNMSALLATLSSVAAQTLRPDIIALHVNESGSVDLTTLRRVVNAAAAPAPVATTGSTENLGFSGGHNRALRALFEQGCDAVVVLNPDLVLDPHALAELAQAHRSLAAHALLGPALELADPESLATTGLVDTLGIYWTASGRHLDRSQGRRLPPLPDAPQAVAGISGACLYVSRAVHDRIVSSTGEFFDEDFIAYREDAELAYRAAALGIKSYLVPRARGRHARRLRGTERGLDAEIDRLGVRNRFLIAFKYGRRRPGFLPVTMLRDAVVVAGVFLKERDSISGLRDAWRLRHAMRSKGAAVRAAASVRK